MVYSRCRLFTSLHISDVLYWLWKSCLGWFSAARAIGSREQVHYSAWQKGMKQQSPMWAKHNAEHRTSTTPAFSRLHRLLPYSHFPPADPMQREVWHTASIGVQWEKGLREAWMPTLTSTRAAPSSLATHSSRVTAGAHCSCKEGIWNSKTLWSFPLTSHWHQKSIFYFVFRGYTSF